MKHRQEFRRHAEKGLPQPTNTEWVASWSYFKYPEALVIP
jgi:hypothetical protein